MQCGRDPADIDQGDILFTPLHAADVTPVQPAFERQVLLGNAFPAPDVPHSFAKRLPDHRGLMLLHDAPFDRIALYEATCYKNTCVP